MLRKILICFLLASCVNPSKKSNLQENKVDIISSTKKNSTLNPNNIEKEVFNKSFLIGIWAEKKEDDAWFWIQKDSIVFVEHPESYYGYDLIEDTLLVFLYDGDVSKSKVLKLTNDSLILKSNYGLSRLYRRNNVRTN